MLEFVLIGGIIAYTIGIALLSVIAIKGPTIGDQILAIDTITYFTLVIFSLLAILLKQSLLTVTLIPLALWIYALDVYISKYLISGDLGA